MPKRNEPDTPSEADSTSAKRQRKGSASGFSANTSPSKSMNASGNLTPRKRGRPRKIVEKDPYALSDNDQDITPKANGTILFTTPKTKRTTGKDTPSRSAKADRSAKRKSANALSEIEQDDDWEHTTRLAREILDEDDEEEVIVSTEPDDGSIHPGSAPATPSKRGRPKGAKNKRSPTPEGDLPPEERYFFQNRMGPPRVSSNSFSALGLLTHEEYFDLMRENNDGHESEKAYLTRLHARAFPQWAFEMKQGFSICLYGYGSKRKMVNQFAEWSHKFRSRDDPPNIVVLNGYASRINLRNVLNTIGSALVEEDETLKLMGQPHDMVDTILSHLTHGTDGGLTLLVNSIDGPALRRVSTQAVLARLAGHPKVNLFATADTPTFPILWSSALRDQFRFLFHDCTTFAPYEAETSPVDDVNELLGRKNKRAGGKEGIGFVLKSLPENARSLYRVLLTEILSIIDDGLNGFGDDDDDDFGTSRRAGTDGAQDTGIEYRALYQKASEEFICSSDMNFRFLLKEFLDHQMVTSKQDSSGTELLGVPLTREEMEAILEDLVIG